MAQLAGILNDDQKADLQEMEQAYKARRNYASMYGFKCGLYGAFRQHFGQHTAKDGFYCGYRAAYDLMEAIQPLGKAENMEYHLGYIKPYSEVARLREQAA